ncbi:unnamed protein product [Protopolystoma xenopodis]|uniref:Transmembrane protein n=1 Tax=Protopolystoma xenopodis TaxID=117903 RepID=A0A3S5FDS7_9PLAT|nr:unnamed protein product [Protopolystoma xenopodis]
MRVLFHTPPPTFLLSASSAPRLSCLSFSSLVATCHQPRLLASVCSSASARWAHQLMRLHSSHISPVCLYLCLCGCVCVCVYACRYRRGHLVSGIETTDQYFASPRLASPRLRPIRSFLERPRDGKDEETAQTAS